MADNTTPKGLTPRDYFAGQALAELITVYKDVLEAHHIHGMITRMAYEYADIMVKQSKED